MLEVRFALKTCPKPAPRCETTRPGRGIRLRRPRGPPALDANATCPDLGPARGDPAATRAPERKPPEGGAGNQRDDDRPAERPAPRAGRELAAQAIALPLPLHGAIGPRYAGAKSLVCLGLLCLCALACGRIIEQVFYCG